jgi:type IX secretion system PorP/SprF family membrane protein
MFPLSDHYVVNGLAINPAFAGSQEALSLTLSYRDQWAGFKDAPKSYILSVHTPVYNDRIGLGFLVENNRAGIFKETNIFGNYAYRLEVLEGRLALGLGFGVTVYNIAWNELLAADANDPQLMNNNVSAAMPNFSLGTYYYTKKYFIGISVPVFLNHELDINTGKYKIGNNLSGSNYFLSGGYEFGLGSRLKLQPSILIKYHPANAVQIDYNAQINMNDKLWMGIGYRSNNILVAMLQCQLNYQIKMAYSYDYFFGRVGKYMNGSHEIVLNYIFRFSRKVIGPRQF